MKVYLVLLSLLTFYSIKIVPKNALTKSPLSLKVTLVKHELDTLRLKTELINNSADTIKALSMTCSWWQFFKLDYKRFKIRTMRCDSNIPTILEIPPHGVYTNVLELKITDLKFFLANPDVQIAFEHVPVIEKNFARVDLIDLLDKPTDSTMFVWSNVFNAK
jgi:hypothetical protein